MNLSSSWGKKEKERGISTLYGGDLLEALGGSSFQQTLSLLSARLGFFNGRRDLLRLWMFGGYRVWRFLPGRVSFDYPIFWVDYSKLFFFKSPYHTWIVWQIRFDLSVVCFAGIKAQNLLLFRTLDAVVALEIFWILVKLCAVWCYSRWFVCCCCDVAVVILVIVKLSVVFFLFLYCFAVLFVGSFTVTNVTFSTLYVRFCFLLCRVV